MEPTRASGQMASGEVLLALLGAVAIALVIIGGFPSVTRFFVTALVLPATLVAGFMCGALPRHRAAFGSLGAAVVAAAFAAVLATPGSRISSTSFPPIPDRVGYVIIGIVGVITFLSALGVGTIVRILTHAPPGRGHPG